MKVFGRELRFGDPKAADIVIFDECNSHIVRRALNKLHSVAVFNQRPEDIWIGPGIVFQFFRCFDSIKFKEAIEHRRGFVIGILKQLRFIYFEACLKIMKPKAAVTFIDNSPSFGWLSRNCRSFPFIAIQNGSRLSYAADNDSGYHVQHLFCFGEHEKNLFPKIGYHVENFHPVGSLVASLHFDHQIATLEEKYDLLVVSSWRGNIGFQQDVKDTMRSMEVMDRLLARYLRSRGIKAAVILRAERDSEHWTMPEVGMSEEEYYQDIYGDCIDIIETDFSKRNVFPLMQQSRIIVSCLSTALLEAYGIGKKILYCNFTGTSLYHSDLDPKIVTDQCDWDGFPIQLDNLLSQRSEDYQRLHKETMRYFMAFPAGSSTHELMAIKIDEIIKDHYATVN